VADPTNHDTHYDRAWCREILWPVLQQRFPKRNLRVFQTLKPQKKSIFCLILAKKPAFAKHMGQFKMHLLVKSIFASTVACDTMVLDLQ
ncbi:MAG TPA: hypothetical protein EYP16_04115, partial [Candidatus Atribacteria bacterium]|nr:hypothetical protein [Candidatus Atribacteria bacterium]